MTKSAQRSEEYERFEALTKRLVAVPKAEINTAVKDKQRKARAKKARPAAASR